MTRMAWAACAALVWPLDAAASEPPPDEPLPTWTIAAGVHFEGPTIGGATIGGAGPGAGAGGLGYAGPLMPSMRASLLLERRIAHPLWLIGRVSGAYDSTVWDDGDSGRLESMVLEGAIGLRLVFTPDEPFQFSTFGLLGGGYARQESGPPGARARAWRAGLDLGFAVDREIIEGLGARLGVIVGEVAYTSTRFSYVDAMATYDTNSSTSWSAALSLSPSLELRYSF